MREPARWAAQLPPRWRATPTGSDPRSCNFPQPPPAILHGVWPFADASLGGTGAGMKAQLWRDGEGDPVGPAARSDGIWGYHFGSVACTSKSQPSSRADERCCSAPTRTHRRHLAGDPGNRLNRATVPASIQPGRLYRSAAYLPHPDPTSPCPRTTHRHLLSPAPST